MVGMAVVALVSSASSARQRDVVVYRTKKDLNESVEAVVYQRWRRAGESHLELSPEVKSPRTVQRRSTEHAALVTRPREEGERDGDGCVDADLAGLDIALKLAGRRSRLGEDGRSVTVCIQRPEKERV